MHKIFDGLYVDQLFHKTERGETTYYPFGIMGRGYLLPAGREADMRRATRWLMAISIAFGVGFAMIFVDVLGTASSGLGTWLVGTAVFILGIALITCIQWRMISGLTPSTAERPGAGEWLRRGRKARAPWTYWVLLVLGLFMLLLAASGFAFAIVDGALAGIASGAVMLLIGALLAGDGALGLIERSRAAKAV